MFGVESGTGWLNPRWYKLQLFIIKPLNVANAVRFSGFVNYFKRHVRIIFFVVKSAKMLQTFLSSNLKLCKGISNKVTRLRKNKNTQYYPFTVSALELQAILVKVKAPRDVCSKCCCGPRWTAVPAWFYVWFIWELLQAQSQHCFTASCCYPVLLPWA